MGEREGDIPFGEHFGRKWMFPDRRGDEDSQYHGGAGDGNEEVEEFTEVSTKSCGTQHRGH